MTIKHVFRGPEVRKLQILDSDGKRTGGTRAFIPGQTQVSAAELRKLPKGLRAQFEKVEPPPAEDAAEPADE